MKYIANPVEVSAYRIVRVDKLDDGRTRCHFEIENPDPNVYASQPVLGVASPEMTARMEPVIGDYWVVQADGYEYLNPKDVFERKYHKKETTE